MPTSVAIVNPSLFILSLLKGKVMPRPAEILQARLRRRVSHDAACLGRVLRQWTLLLSRTMRKLPCPTPEQALLSSCLLLE